MTTTAKTEDTRRPGDADYHTERWAYAGVRVGDDDKATHAWVGPDPADGTRLWSSRASYRVGGLYDVQTARIGSRMWRRGNPEPTAREHDDRQQVAQWEVESEAARRRLARMAAERKAKRDGGVIDAATADLCSIAAGMRTFTEVDMLASSVKQRLYDAWHKGTG